MTRKEKQAELVFQVGLLVGPLVKAYCDPSHYYSEEFEHARGAFFGGSGPFNHEFSSFCHSGGYVYEAQKQDVWNNLSEIDRLLRNPPDVTYSKIIEQHARRVIQAINSVPVRVESTIFEANTPFATHNQIRAHCTTVCKEIIWLDRYFDHSVFHRYFSDTPSHVLVTLVTSPQTKMAGSKDKQRYAEFLDLSRLFAAQRGQSGYRLVMNSNFHDRWLKCDDKLFVLGGSVKDLDRPFTISKLDPLPQNVQQFSDAVANGAEQFGPNQPNHP